MSTTAEMTAGTPGNGGPIASAPIGYFARTELPLASLIFLLPIIVLYELGTVWFASDAARGTEQRVRAFDWLQIFFHWFNASGKYLPAMVLAVILVAWHVARRDKWLVSGWHVLGMAVESILLAVPLIGMGVVVMRYFPPETHAVAKTMLAVSGPHRSLLVLSLGAGVYEELLFRLIGFTVLNILFVDVLKMTKGWAALLMVLTSGILFSCYHYWGAETFNWGTFTFRTVAGLYFGAIFICRGFGITAGSHAAYDVSVVLLRIVAST